ncbi:MAG: acetolactate synthase small subunit [Armatimonadetes bacterium]|nr:acetolactate synthase small subunit [Armatimonadota bacterium]NIM24274.1 acetolactate synthase small subunit [Armatimonadota bacterium]NIM68143.1 acetolactate synthase small subunit [Armatimonadota bacterium]NIM76603.1 acetolactate synthase small subunit [Armatimonadota bacterium]NIN06348.1 acetolactate synthase small subunit [Armatimonadota bacterium]
MASNDKQHTISVLVENRPRVLARTASLFSRRGFNIDSLAVSTTEDPTISRMTIVVAGSDSVLEQITKQLNKLVDIIKVLDHTDEPLVSRELALIKVNADPDCRAEIMQVVDIFRGNIVDVGERTFIIECTGTAAKIDALQGLLEKYGIREMMRTGRIVLARGLKTT